LEIGGLAIVDGQDGTAVVLQVRDVRVVERQAAELSVNLDDSDLAGFAGSALRKPVVRAAAGTAAVLGTLTAGEFCFARRSHPRPGRHPTDQGRRWGRPDDLGVSLMAGPMSIQQNRNSK
jgi:hypothetical protein